MRSRRVFNAAVFNDADLQGLEPLHENSSSRDPSTETTSSPSSSPNDASASVDAPSSSSERGTPASQTHLSPNVSVNTPAVASQKPLTCRCVNEAVILAVEVTSRDTQTAVDRNDVVGYVNAADNLNVGVSTATVGTSTDAVSSSGTPSTTLSKVIEHISTIAVGTSTQVPVAVTVGTSTDAVSSSGTPSATLSKVTEHISTVAVGTSTEVPVAATVGTSTDAVSSNGTPSATLSEVTECLSTVAGATSARNDDVATAGPKAESTSVTSMRSDTPNPQNLPADVAAGRIQKHWLRYRTRAVFLMIMAMRQETL